LKTTRYKQWDILAPIHLNLAMFPEGRERISGDPETMRRLEGLLKASKIASTKLEPIVLIATAFTWAILNGSQGREVENLKHFPGMDRRIVSTLQATIDDAEAFANFWPLEQALVALQYLTTLGSNRKTLGDDWLLSLRVAISKGINEDNPSAVESALICLSNYARDPEHLPALKAQSSVFITSARRVVEEKDNAESWSGARDAAKQLAVALD
jgi:hypothetical protein